uniref:beta-mannosidase n=1 Tax=Saccoglossus kowalevskii TaxID=10224 RepID=A0ABM0MVX4_SACKO|nr:PREDICTED: beta-mannosidase-like [Saccoglossus kowalevskii]
MATIHFLVICCLIVCAGFRFAVADYINLNGKWDVTNADGKMSVPGNVPGCVHMALLDSKKIADPYNRFNDVLNRSIALEPWTYSRKFNATKTLVTRSSVVLVAEGLDTVAMVKINDKVVGNSTNMFIRNVFDIKSAIKEGENTISVIFQSAITYANHTAMAHKYEVPPSCPPSVQNGECHVNYIRKEQCSFSWDWGPAFAPQGIWKNIHIEAWNCAVIRETSALAVKIDGSWALKLTTYVNVANNAKVKSQQVTVMSQIPNLGISYSKPVTISPGKNVPVQMVIPVKQAKTWWPRGYGEQHLYEVMVQLTCPTFEEKSTRRFRVGFRTVELVQEPITYSPGLSFYFKINDKPIFLKGSNWIPADAFQERVNKTVLQNLLQSAADANMNALRVWGGGIYEQDAFYNIADELGIMIWQDFMFACSMYPTNEDFLKSVTQEATQYGTDKNATLYDDDYRKLYIETIKPVIDELDSTRPFIGSSPTNGDESMKEHWIAKNPADPLYGDVHFYDYTNDCWDINTFPKPRFASEYGYQSWPSFETIRSVSIEEDWDYSSNFSGHRQHHATGNEEMKKMILQHYKLPNNPNKTYEDMLYLTQVLQAMCIKTETEYYRSLQSSLDKNGQGKTMGALYWQLNDIWQAPTWASIEYGGKWKMLHYYAQRFFAPVHVAAFKTCEKSGLKLCHVTIYGINDLTQNIDGVSLKATMWKWENKLKPLNTWTIKKSYTQNAQSSIQLYNREIQFLLFSGKCAVQTSKCVMTMELVQNGTTIAQNVLYLKGFNEAKGIGEANVKVSNVSVSEDSDMKFNITLTNDNLALFTWLDAPGIAGRFSDNGFFMTTSTKTIMFHAWQKTTADDLKKALSVKVYNNI